MASLDSGKLEDIPFEKLFDDNVDLTQECCDISQIQGGRHDFKYRTLSTSAGLQSNYVEDANGKRITMAQIASPYIVTNDGAFKLVVRNQNNVYYPNIIRSLYIPQNPQLNNNQAFVLNLSNACDRLDRAGIPLSQHDVQTIIDNQKLDLDTQEYYYITDEANYTNGINGSSDEEFCAIVYRKLEAPFIKKMYAIRLLKETAVIPSYTRISPKGVEELWWNRTTGNETNLTPKKVPTYKYYGKGDVRNTIFIPGVESYGEGIFLDINVGSIENDIIERYTFVHTFSHIIMKEMEFQCGYPLSSLKEKIYQTEDNDHYGILIYTIGGSEGSYGGLVTLLPSDPNAKDGGKLITLIKNALERAKDCPNDPICINEEEDKQGHCFACVDIPEISCCKWNKNLNRRIVLKYAFPAPSTTEDTHATESQSHTSTNETANITTKNTLDEDDILA